MTWLQKLDLSLGAQEGTEPEIGDNRFVSTISTSNGVPTAKLYVRQGALLYVYYAEGGQPLDAIVALAEKVFGRL